ncbi:MAG: hypothetical protein ACI9UN_001310 [Granulosicoccus sp.]|jgi:hypothetical protein
MKSRRTIHVLLTFLLLFGQFSSLAHALEHVYIPQGTEPCQAKGEDHYTHHASGHAHHHALNQPHGHGDNDNELTSSTSTLSHGLETSESVTCLIFHLHGSVQAGFTAEPRDVEVFAHLRTVYIRENAAVIQTFTALYDTRGPPADVG